MKTIGKNKRNSFFLLVFTLAVAGCATSLTPVYYTLPQPAPAATGASTNVAAGIGPFELPEYLDRPQIITVGPGATITLDEFHRWIEPLHEIFVRTLATTVGRRLGSDAIFATPALRGFEAPYRVLGSVQRFETSSDGRAILEVQWTIVDRDDAIAKPGSRGYYEANVGGSADIAARVHALGEVLGIFAADVAGALQALPRP